MQALFRQVVRGTQRHQHRTRQSAERRPAQTSQSIGLRSRCGGLALIVARPRNNVARRPCWPNGALPMKYLLTLLVVLMMPTAALAKGECKEERKKFCAGLEKKEVLACLRKHEAVLGAPCKTKLEARAKAKEARDGEDGGFVSERWCQLFVAFNRHSAAADLS